MCSHLELLDPDVVTSDSKCLVIFSISVISQRLGLVWTVDTISCFHLFNRQRRGSSKQEMIACRTWSWQAVIYFSFFTNVSPPIEVDFTKICWHGSVTCKNCSYNKKIKWNQININLITSQNRLCIFFSCGTFFHSFVCGISWKKTRGS